MPWDSPLAALAELVAACADVTGDPLDTGREHVAGEEEGLRVSELVVESPLEMGIRADDHGVVELVAAPPRQAMETTVMPVLHRIRLRVEVV